VGLLVLPEKTIVDAFSDWARDAEPRLRQALTALLGVDEGLEMTSEALALAWEKWPVISVMVNPTGYVYAAARNMGRRRLRRRAVFLPVPVEHMPWVEPALPRALARLSEQQRLIVTLLHGYEWSMSEVADLLGLSKSTIQNHAERGLAALQKQLGAKR
jgi:DNA-directed RNA polymerase specialized sigma24 family protein